MFKDITPIELHEYLEFNSPLILDVREIWEYEKCHLNNSLLMPMGSIMSLIDTLDKDKETVWFVIMVYAQFRWLDIF